MTHEIKIDFNKVIGKIKPIHAVNNGPVQTLSGGWNISNYYRDMAIPYSRLHDTDAPYGAMQFVDIHCIFEDFDADPELPESYNFWATDICIKGIIDAGGKPFYRLGESIDHTPHKLFVHPPKDAHKWAVVCEHIVRHYNEGWANGFHFGIEYWEIWNEPDCKLENMWTGSWEQYFELYSVTANHLKNTFGDSIKVGGFAATNTNYLFTDTPTERQKYCEEFTHAFFKYITAPETAAPLDFFSYHKYTNDPREYYNYNNVTRTFLDSLGFEHAEAILDEWHNGYFNGYNELHSIKTSAETAVALVAGQKSAVDMMMYYDLRKNTRFNAMVSAEKAPLSDFFPFEMFGKLYRLGTEVDSGEFDEKSDVAVLAAKSSSKAGIMIANMGANREPLTLNLSLSGTEGYSSLRARVMNTEDSPVFPTTFLDTVPAENITLSPGILQSVTYIELE